MFGTEEHHGVHKHHVRDGKQTDPGHMEQTGEESGVHELDSPGEDKQIVCYAHGSGSSGSETFEQDGC
eukprot:10101041-Heterocapsa_arctica.AAC.1